jgi:iron(III) transport system permease protein
MIVINSFNDNGHFSIASYISAFTSISTYKALLNTFRMVLIVLLGTWLLGGTLAFIKQKTDFKYKKLLDILVFLSFTIPSYILSISWIEFVSRGGYLNRILKLLIPNIKYNINAYSIEASAIILALHLYPLVYYGISNALKIMNSPFEQSAKVCGAKKSRIIFTVILPLIIPSFISTGLLVVSRSMANFGVTAQIALPAAKEVLTTRIFSAMSDLNLPLVSVLSLLLILISFLLFRLSERILRNKKYSVTSQSQTTNEATFKLGKSRALINTIISIFFLLTIFVPFATILVSSFLKRWGIALKASNFTFNNYAILFTGKNILGKPLVNSLCYGITSAIIAVIIGSFIVYLDKYTNNKKTKWIMNISQLPIAFPNMILAIAAMFAWINEPFKLYGTGAIIIVTYTVLFIPICIKQMLGASKNIDPSLDNAAKTMGIPLLERYYRLFIPQVKDSVISGLLICFLISLREIPISLLLYTAGTKTLGVMLFTIQSNSYGLEMTSTIAVVVIILSLVGNIVLRKIGSKGSEKYE